jgi:hypothetical protein
MEKIPALFRMIRFETKTIPQSTIVSSDPAAADR